MEARDEIRSMADAPAKSGNDDDGGENPRLFSCRSPDRAQRKSPPAPLYPAMRSMALWGSVMWTSSRVRAVPCLHLSRAGVDVRILGDWKRKVVTFLGVFVPLMIGCAVLSFGLEAPFLPLCITIAGVASITQLGFSLCGLWFPDGIAHIVIAWLPLRKIQPFIT